jgi:hypothetical protein
MARAGRLSNTCHDTRTERDKTAPAAKLTHRPEVMREGMATLVGSLRQRAAREKNRRRNWLPGISESGRRTQALEKNVRVIRFTPARPVARIPLLPSTRWPNVAWTNRPGDRRKEWTETLRRRVIAGERMIARERERHQEAGASRTWLAPAYLFPPLRIAANRRHKKHIYISSQNRGFFSPDLNVFRLRPGVKM